MRPSPAPPFGTSPIAAEIPQGASELQERRKNDQRRLVRAPLSLPVRIRWLGPFGLETEITQTVNASRAGLLILTMHQHGEGSPVWVTFPYDSERTSAEPEIPGSVTRCISSPEGTHAIGIKFQRNRQLFMRFDRRQNPRVPLALLIRVTQSDRDPSGSYPHAVAPWPEETMTMDVSPNGLRFCTLRLYAADQHISVSLPDGRWLDGGKKRARVVRVDELKSDSPLLQVAAEFLP
jgi:hypothetical protein